jgi:hypothetical protein
MKNVGFKNTKTLDIESSSYIKKHKKMAKKYLLTIGIILSFLLSLNLINSTITIYQSSTYINDTFSDSANPTDTRYTQTQVFTGTNIIGDDWRGFMQFNIDTSNVISLISANLSVYIGSGNAPSGATTFYLYNVTSNWAQTTLTYNLQPTIGVAFDSVSVSQYQGNVWKTFNVTSSILSQIANGRGYAFDTTDALGSNVQFYSANNETPSFAFRPRLTFEYNGYINIINPTENQIFSQDSPTATFNISTGVNMTLCRWSPNNGTTNYTIPNVAGINTSFYLQNTTMVDGTYVTTIYCNQSSDGTWRWYYPVPFEVDSINITQCRNLNVNRTYQLRNNLNKNSNCLYFKNNSLIFNGNGYNVNGTTGLINFDTYSNILIKDLNLSSTSNLFSINSGANNNTLLNCSYIQSNESISAGQLYRKWYFDIQVNGTSGYLQNAQVDIINVSNRIVTSLLTNATGNIAQQYLIEYLNDAGTRKYQSPWTINVSASSYNVNSTTYNLTLVNNTYEYVTLISSNQYPSVTLSLPSDNIWSKNQFNNFSCQSSDENANLRNITLFVWNSTNIVNQTNKTITGSSNISNFSSVPLLSDSYKWNCYVCDNTSLCNWSSTGNRTLNIDTIYPLIDFGIRTELNNSNKSQDFVYINVSVTETNFQNITFNLYNSTFSLKDFAVYTTQTYTENFTSEPNGIYYYNVTLCDSANNCNTTATRKITLDTTPPTVNILFPIDSQSYNSNITINWTASESLLSLSSCWYTNDSGAKNYSITCNQNFTQNLSEGTFTYKIYANDTLNNVGNKSVTFSISLGAPAINLNYPVDNKYFNNGTNLYFNFTATDGDGLSVCQLWGNWTGTWHNNYTWVKPNSNQMNFTIVNITNNNMFFRWNVWCNDTLNNGKFGSTNFTFTIDTIKPNINESGYSPSIVYTGTNVTIFANISDLNLNTIWIMINHSGTYQNTTITDILNGLYYYNLSGANVQNFENISWVWYANDSANNVNNSKMNSFITTNRNPYNIQIITPNNSFINYNSFMINFSGADFDGDSLNFSLYNSSNGISFSFFNSTTNRFINFTGFNSSDLAKNYYYITANDTKLQNQSATYIFTIDKSNPSEPVITNPVLYTTSVYCSPNNIPLDYLASDTNIDYCEFNVTKLGDVTVSTTRVYDCSNTTFNTAYDGIFIQLLTLTVVDRAGNINQSTRYFSVDSDHSSCVSILTPLGSGGGGEEIIVESNKTFCGDNICQKNGNDYGIKEDYYNCPQDCKGFDFDALFNSFFKNCWDNDPKTICFWFGEDAEEPSVCGNQICEHNENFIVCKEDCGNFNLKTLLSNCIDKDPKSPCFWNTTLASYLVLGILLMILSISLTKVNYQNKKVSVPRYIVYRFKKRK